MKTFAYPDFASDGILRVAAWLRAKPCFKSQRADFCNLFRLLLRHRTPTSRQADKIAPVPAAAGYGAGRPYGRR